MPKANLTDSFAAKAKPGRWIDTNRKAPRGFLLHTTPAKSRSWRLQYRVKATGKQREYTIGGIKAWSIDLAREEAARLRRIVDTGGDPLAENEEKRAAPTVAELVAHYKDSAEFKRLAPGTQVNYGTLLNVHILPALGSRKVAAVTSDDVARLHRRITEAGTSRQANATKTMLRTLFSMAVKGGMRADNPASGIKGNPEHSRERYLSPEEFDRLLGVLDRWQDKRCDSVDAIRTMMLTGARRGEVLGSDWDQFDLDAEVWTKPAASTKQRRPHRVPLNKEVVEILQRRKAAHDAAEPKRVVRLHAPDYVFAGGGDTAHKARLERDWRVIRAEAGLSDLRVHDLRHSFASVLVGQGLSLPIIGAMLGHSKPSTTARYAHLADQPLRDAAAIVGKIVGRKGAK
jgi:integrase